VPLSDPAAVVLDTSVLLNFVKIGRLDLVEVLAVPLLVLDDVRAEVTRPEQLAALDAAIGSGAILGEPVVDPVEVGLFAALSSAGRLGQGECAVLAVALTRGMVAAVQDGPAQAEARRRDRHVRICTTEDIVVHAIRAGGMTIPEADLLLEEWRLRHRFASRLTTFRGIV
jgi:predicted nucleic acid-binding protein